MKKEQRSRWLEIVGIVVAIAVILKVVFRVLRIFTAKRPPIVSSGGSINVATNGWFNTWQGGGNAYATGNSVDPKQIETQGDFSSNLGSTVLAAGWTVTIYTKPYPTGQNLKTGTLTITETGDGRVHIRSSASFDGTVYGATRLWGKRFSDPEAPSSYDFQAATVVISGLQATPSSQSLTCTGKNWQISIG